MPIAIRSELTDEDFIIELSGHLDEGLHLPENKLRLYQRVVFECDQLMHVNSLATQIWAVWMRSMPNGQQFVFRKVRPRIIHIFNVFSGFLPPEAIVESFYMPYECEKCGYEILWLARRGNEYLEAVSGASAKLRFTKEINCTKCTGQMTLGFWEDKYLNFLNLKEE